MPKMSSGFLRIICPKCNAENSFVGTYKEKEYIRFCNAKGCDYKEAVKIDAYEENL